jgi:hypothetical protein
MPVVGLRAPDPTTGDGGLEEGQRLTTRTTALGSAAAAKALRDAFR